MIGLTAILKARNYLSVKPHMHIFPGEHHFSVMLSKLSLGLRALWEGNAIRAFI